MPRLKPFIWDEPIILDLIERAERGEISEARLGGAREAKLFRFAIYKYRRTNNRGKDLSILIDKQDSRIVRLIRARIEVKVLERESTT